MQAPGEVVIDDELAKNFGMESLDALKTAVRDSIAGDYSQCLASQAEAPAPGCARWPVHFRASSRRCSAQEFENIWKQVQSDMQQSGKTFADEETTEEEARAEYQKIADRRVRLGLVLAEIGEHAKVQISDEEVTQALVERARQFPGQERMVWDFYRKNPQALAELRAPIFEEKVVDHILATASITEKPVSKDELMDESDGETKAAGASDEVKKAKPKSRAKKAVASEEPTAE